MTLTGRSRVALAAALLVWSGSTVAASEAPVAVTDLSVTAPVMAGQLHRVVRWTAPEDQSSGSPNGESAASYDLRYAVSPILTDQDFAAATRVDDEMTAAGRTGPPAAPGSPERFEVVGLAPGRTYHFAVRSSDSAGNVSELSNPAAGTTDTYEGYGHVVTGGAEGRVCHVTTLANSGAGSLRACIFPGGGRNCAAEPLTVVFDVGGTIQLDGDIFLNADDCNITIDGSTAPSPGITIRKQPCAGGLSSCPVGDACLQNGEFKIGGNESTATRNVIVTYLRFRGNYELGWGPCLENSGATIGLQYHLKEIVLDHLTIRNGVDSAPDLWTGNWEANDITISNSLMGWSNHPLTISDGGAAARRRLSVHHNAFARSGERMPNLNNLNEDVDFRNNFVFDWEANGSGSYASRVRNPDGQNGTRKTSANIVGNVWLPGNGRPNRALVYGEGPGSSSDPNNGDGGPAGCRPSDGCAGCPPQGTVVTGSFMGELWVAGNRFPQGACDTWSTVDRERAVPAEARVTTDDAGDLTTTLLPHVGTHFREADEESLIGEIMTAAGGGTPDPPPGAVINLHRTDRD